MAFRVDDAHALPFNFATFAQLQLHIRAAINSALRKIVDRQSSAQLLGEADQIGRELAASLDEGGFGYAVRAVPEDVASCLK